MCLVILDTGTPFIRNDTQTQTCPTRHLLHHCMFDSRLRIKHGEVNNGAFEFRNCSRYEVTDL